MTLLKRISPLEFQYREGALTCNRPPSPPSNASKTDLEQQLSSLFEQEYDRFKVSNLRFRQDNEPLFTLKLDQNACNLIIQTASNKDHYHYHLKSHVIKHNDRPVGNDFLPSFVQHIEHLMQLLDAGKASFNGERNE